MDAWAAYLRGQADALGLPVIGTTMLTVAEAAQQLRAIVQRVDDFGVPAAERTLKPTGGLRECSLRSLE